MKKIKLFLPALLILLVLGIGIGQKHSIISTSPKEISSQNTDHIASIIAETKKQKEERQKKFERINSPNFETTQDGLVTEEYTGDYAQQWGSQENTANIVQQEDGRMVVKDTLPPALKNFKNKMNAMTAEIVGDLNIEESQALFSKETEMQQLIQESEALLAELQEDIGADIDVVSIEASLEEAHTEVDRITKINKEFNKVEEEYNNVNQLSY